MNWEKGRDTIEDLLRRGHLDRVATNEVEAQHLMTKTRAHLQTAAAVADTDPEIAYDALYAAARKHSPHCWCDKGCDRHEPAGTKSLSKPPRLNSYRRSAMCCARSDA
jgi:hypothetical protein